MDKVEYTKKLLGNLVKQARAASMDQEELALRTGISKNTVSRLERGKGINSDTLLTILNQLEVLDPLIETIEKEYELVSNNPLRKSSLLEKELPNDF
ncbi:helix-turn-helix domain-containing protein [Alteromonas sp. DY56-G5]|uniref:helix-turn-helix domain-containing protein n=1 Tax=Alteromonas sp. DY56-G5 TaxID=2967128 RepID=UPI00243D4D2F|nr:helix-turn-helix transcriptional regulator [Pseudomonadota bacterium]|tara:strand:- start:796 stop:1086 length:291 start_codon:yes stop_codon:yes gene_type:complete